MAHTFYAQSDRPESTMTVGQLIERLQAFDSSAPVIFKSPRTGSFGPNTTYSLDAVEHVSLERTERDLGPQVDYDVETGEEHRTSESWIHVFRPWSGVVIG